MKSVVLHCADPTCRWTLVLDVDHYAAARLVFESHQRDTDHFPLPFDEVWKAAMKDESSAKTT